MIICIPLIEYKGDKKMTVKDLLNKTKQNYELAMEYEDECFISNVIKGYKTFSNLYRLDMIATKTFDKYFNDFYTMANNVYVRFIRNDEKMNESIENDSITNLYKI